MEEVEVRVVDRDLAANGHHESGPDDRQVEGLAVVRRARAKRFDLAFELFDEFSLRTEVKKHVLPQDQLLVSEVSDANEKDVRAGPAREPSCFSVKEQHVLPSVRRRALEPEVRDEKRVARSPPDDLESEFVEYDPPLAHFETRT